MTNSLTLTSSMQDYLEAILDLSEKAEAVRVTDISAKLNIAKASVTQAIKSLKDLGLVAQDRYGPVELTIAGKEIATGVQFRHRTLRRFLVEVLGVEPEIAEKDACLMEHVVSRQTMKKLVEYLQMMESMNRSTDGDASLRTVAAESPMKDEPKEERQ